MAEITDSPKQQQHLSQSINIDETQNQQQQIKQEPITSQQPHNSDTNGQLNFTLRLLMQGKEVGSIIGKKGDNIKRFREVSGAKINVSDSSCPDRIVTLSGLLDEVYNAFSMICTKFEEQIPQVAGSAVNSSSSPAGNSPQARAGSGGGANISQTGSGAGSNSPSSVTDPLFGLPSTSILNNALKKEADILTINNNSTTTINNNNLSAPNKNLTSAVSSSANSNNNGNTTISKITSSSSAQHPSITLRLIVPASQCGSLIGRGGAKIKEIREMSGATIQVAPEVLPNSTERVVSISGPVESLKSCAYQICVIMVESPPKGYVIPYRPKPALNPMLLAAATAGQAAAAYNLPGQFALSGHPDVNRLFVANNPLAAAFNPAAAAAAANLRAAAATGQAAAALSAAVTSQQSITQEMAIPNGLIGCVIGKGGSKINEIRQLSGANIKISNSEEGAKNRTVTINGTPDAINLAQYLITAR